MNRSQGISNITVSIVISVVVVVIGVGSYFIIQYLGTDPVLRDISKELKIEHSILESTKNIKIIKQEGDYLKGEITSSKGNKIFLAILNNGGVDIISLSNSEPICEQGIAYGFSENMLAGCISNKTGALSIKEAKDKVGSNDIVVVVGVIDFPDDPSGSVILKNGDEYIELEIETPEQIMTVEDDGVVIVSLKKDKVVSIDSLESENEDNDTEEENEESVVIEPFSSIPPEYYYNIYDLNESDYLKLLND